MTQHGRPRAARRRREPDRAWAIEGSIVFEHAENRVQQFPHHRHQGYHFAFSTGLQMQVKRAQVGSKTHRGEGGHGQSPANMAVSHFADARFLMHRSARLMVSRILSRVRHHCRTSQLAS
jgi:hypothetical protein